MEDVVKIGIAKFIHDGNFARAEFDAGPDIMENNGLYELLDKLGVTVTETETARLTKEEEKEYGTIYRLGLASGHMAEIVSNTIKRGEFSLALISNCIGLMGVLGGVQKSGNEQPLRVGLVYFDAHADINTPETTRSGLMGGMPVASATGMCFHRLRRQAGLEVALPTRYVTYVGVREVDALEYEILDRSDVEYITVDDVKAMSRVIRDQMNRLSTITDLIYMHAVRTQIKRTLYNQELLLTFYSQHAAITTYSTINQIFINIISDDEDTGPMYRVIASASDSIQLSFILRLIYNTGTRAKSTRT